MRKKTETKQSLKKKLDAIFSKYIRLRDCDRNGIVTCPLCWAKIHWKEAQNMHFVSRGVLKYRFDESNCFAGCKRCNVILNWNYPKYTLFMIDQYWKEYVEKILNDKEIFKVWIDWYREKIEYYKQEVERLYWDIYVIVED